LEAAESIHYYCYYCHVRGEWDDEQMKQSCDYSYDVLDDDDGGDDDDPRNGRRHEEGGHGYGYGARGGCWLWLLSSGAYLQGQQEARRQHSGSGE
jgi:hypothetical protein